MRDEEAAFLDDRAEQLTARTGLTRTRLLKLGAAVPLAVGIGRLPAPARAALRATTTTPIVKPLPPEWFVNYGTNAEMRWDSLQKIGYTIPSERFFVRDHTATPLIDLTTWRLNIFGTGLRGNGASFSYDELRKLPHREVVSFVECAGNGRSLFALQQGTPAAGTQWGLGAIGVARWRGVPLAEVLERAGVTKQAVDVMPYGLDSTVVSAGVDYGHVRRPIPIGKALDDALLAYEMNGEKLPPDHGYPLRLIVPGWVGVANIKWVGQIEVSKQPLFSLWNTQQYVMQGDAYPDKPVLTTQVVKSAWQLAPNARVPAGTRTRLRGRAWSGISSIRRVEVSTDQGATWKAAKLHGRNKAGSWVEFDYNFPARPPGGYELWARATDRAGNTQPATVPFNSGGYLFGAVVRHPVIVQ